MQLRISYFISMMTFKALQKLPNEKHYQTKRNEQSWHSLNSKLLFQKGGWTQNQQLNQQLFFGVPCKRENIINCLFELNFVNSNNNKWITKLSFNLIFFFSLCLSRSLFAQFYLQTLQYLCIQHFNSWKIDQKHMKFFGRIHK